MACVNHYCTFFWSLLFFFFFFYICIAFWVCFPLREIVYLFEYIISIFFFFFWLDCGMFLDHVTILFFLSCLAFSILILAFSLPSWRLLLRKKNVALWLGKRVFQLSEFFLDVQKALGKAYVTPTVSCLMDERDHTLLALAALTTSTLSPPASGITTCCVASTNI